MRRREKGFGVVGMVVTLVIASIVAAGAGMTALQVIKGNDRNQNHARVIQQAHSFGRWFSRDALSAWEITTGDDEFITIFSRDWESGDTCDISYILSDAVGSLKEVYRNRVKRNIDGVITENVTTLISDSLFSANITQQDDTYILDIETRWGKKSAVQEYKITKRFN
jgi:type II secretory pathway pseudopilin PulG